MMPRSTDDRRQGPRRAEEVAMHYATMGVIQAALALDAARNDPTPGFPDAPSEVAQEAIALEALTRAVETYREAEASLATADAVR